MAQAGYRSVIPALSGKARYQHSHYNQVQCHPSAGPVIVEGGQTHKWQTRMVLFSAVLTTEQRMVG